MKILILKIIYKIIARMFVVNVYKNPQYLSDNGKYCHRNMLILKIHTALWELEKDIKLNK